jgi:hypothetical protein
MQPWLLKPWRKRNDTIQPLKIATRWSRLKPESYHSCRATQKSFPENSRIEPEWYMPPITCGNFPRNPLQRKIQIARHISYPSTSDWTFSNFRIELSASIILRHNMLGIARVLGNDRGYRRCYGPMTSWKYHTSQRKSKRYDSPIHNIDQ